MASSHSVGSSVEKKLRASSRKARNDFSAEEMDITDSVQDTPVLYGFQLNWSLSSATMAGNRGPPRVRRWSAFAREFGATRIRHRFARRKSRRGDLDPALFSGAAGERELRTPQPGPGA